MLSAITTLFGSAMPCKRAAKFGVSPTIACSWEVPEQCQITDDHQPRCDAYPRSGSGAWVFRPHSSDQLQPCADGSLGVVLVGLRIREIHQSPGHELSRQAAERSTVSATHF